MKSALHFVAVCLFAITLGGCAANLNHTHRGNLLDDKVTTQRAQAALDTAGNDFKNIRVSTKNGVVTLTGTVNSRGARDSAEQIVQNIHRATGLEDDLQVANRSDP
jgi:osmotically-inducible protein OsmY